MNNQRESSGSQMEALMQYYREELLRYQRAVPPGKTPLRTNSKTNMPADQPAETEKPAETQPPVPPEQEAVPLPAPVPPCDGGGEETEPPAVMPPAPAPPPDAEPAPPANGGCGCTGPTGEITPLPDRPGGQLPPWGPPPHPEPEAPAVPEEQPPPAPVPEAPATEEIGRPGWTPDTPFWPVPPGGPVSNGMYQPVIPAEELEDMLTYAERRALDRPLLLAELGPEALAVAAAAARGQSPERFLAPGRDSGDAPPSPPPVQDVTIPAEDSAPTAPAPPPAAPGSSGECRPFTASWGMPVDGDQHVMTAGRNGAALLQDLHFIDKIQHFTRERIPERVVHAKGAGAFGSFRVYQSMEAHTTAAFLQDPGKTTDVFVRFSLAAGPKGSADTARDIRGFAVKFYTSEGIYDLVGNHLPVFLVSDAMKLPDVIHALKPDPVNNLTNMERFFDFVSLMPETVNALVRLYSDLGTVRSFRHMNGHGVNTYVWVNAAGKRVYVKYHWLTQQGLETIDRLQAEELAGSDPDTACRELYTSLIGGEKTSYELCVQMMEPETAGTLEFDPLDCTKIWPQDRFPLVRVGMLTLDRAPDNYFAQVEQACFSPANLVPGIEFSADKMLQGRAFAYGDAARYRVGANFDQLPINRSRSVIANHQQNGSMTFHYSGGPVNYSPNSLGGNCPEVVLPPAFGMEQHGAAGRYGYDRVDHFTQAGNFYRSLSEEQQRHLVDNISEDLGKVNGEILGRVLGMLSAADADLGRLVQRTVDRPTPRR